MKPNDRLIILQQTSARQSRTARSAYRAMRVRQQQQATPNWRHMPPADVTDLQQASHATSGAILQLRAIPCLALTLADAWNQIRDLEQQIATIAAISTERPHLTLVTL